MCGGDGPGPDSGCVIGFSRCHGFSFRKETLVCLFVMENKIEESTQI